MIALICRVLTAMLAAVSLFPRAATAGVRVVTTLPTFGAIVNEVGGGDVTVHTVASPRFNPHFIQPKPTDVLAVKRADLFLHAGLDLEPWRIPLVNAAGNPAFRPGGARELDLSKGIRLLDVPTVQPSRAAGDIHLYGNPHYWLDPRNVVTLAERIAEKLGEIDPEHREEYRRRFEQFRDECNRRIEGWRARMKPFAGSALIGYHDSWPYLMEFLGLEMKHFLEPKPGIPPTPKHLQHLRELLRSGSIAVLLQSSHYPREAAERLSEETGVPLALGCEQVGALPACGSYFDLVEHNVRTLEEALAR